MAVAAAGLTRSGLNTNSGTDTRELYLKVFSGEVLATFRRMNKIRDRVRTRVLTSGKVAQFPAIGKAAANYFTPGQSLLTDSNLIAKVEHGEQLIYIDKKLISGTFIDELDQMLQHFQNRSEIAAQLGIALATRDDQQLLQVLSAAARATAGPTADHPLGAVWYSASGAMTVSGLATFTKAVRLSAQRLDENDVPEDGRMLVVTPEIYRRLPLEQESLVDRDYTSSNGGQDSGEIRRFMGFELVKSNNVPQTDTSGNPDSNQHGGATAGNDYTLDNSDTVALAFHSSAIGSASLMGVRTSATWFEEYQGWLLLAKQAVGHGILQNGAAIEFSDSTTGVGLTNTTEIDALA